MKRIRVQLQKKYIWAWFIVGMRNSSELCRERQTLWNLKDRETQRRSRRQTRLEAVRYIQPTGSDTDGETPQHLQHQTSSLFHKVSRKWLCSFCPVGILISSNQILIINCSDCRVWSERNCRFVPQPLFLWLFLCCIVMLRWCLSPFWFVALVYVGLFLLVSCCDDVISCSSSWDSLYHSHLGENQWKAPISRQDGALINLNVGE